MTEADWLTSTNPQAMLEFIRGTWCAARGNANAANRKLRLFACACCWKVSESLGRDAETIMEWNASVGENAAEWAKRWAGDQKRPSAAERAALLRCIFGNPYRESNLAVRWGQLHEHAPGCAPRVSSWLTWHDGVVVKLAQAAYDERVGRVCHNCNGNGDILLSAVKMQVATCTDCCGSGRISDGTLDAGRLAVLADALEEAGCKDEAMLRHLRGEEKYLVMERPKVNLWGWRKSDAPHVRGCWVVDLLLGKE